MIRYFWTRGRFGWPFISLILLHTVLLVMFDYAWRLIQIPFLQLFLVFFGLWIIGIIAIVGAAVRLSRRR